MKKKKKGTRAYALWHFIFYIIWLLNQTETRFNTLFIGEKNRLISRSIRLRSGRRKKSNINRKKIHSQAERWGKWRERSDRHKVKSRDTIHSAPWTRGQMRHDPAVSASLHRWWLRSYGGTPPFTFISNAVWNICRNTRPARYITMSSSACAADDVMAYYL